MAISGVVGLNTKSAKIHPQAETTVVGIWSQDNSEHNRRQVCSLITRVDLLLVVDYWMSF